MSRSLSPTAFLPLSGPISYPRVVPSLYLDRSPLSSIVCSFMCLVSFTIRDEKSAESYFSYSAHPKNVHAGRSVWQATCWSDLSDWTSFTNICGPKHSHAFPIYPTLLLISPSCSRPPPSWSSQSALLLLLLLLLLLPLLLRLAPFMSLY